jgi:hypothetical protein
MPKSHQSMSLNGLLRADGSLIVGRAMGDRRCLQKIPYSAYYKNKGDS